MKRTVMMLATAAVGLMGLGAVVQPTAGGSPVAVAANVEGVCQPSDEHRYPTATTASLTVTAPTGFEITGYCVKAGSVNNGDGPEVTTLTTPTSSVTISHSSGKNISHYVIYLAPVPPPADVAAPTAEPVFTSPTCDVAGSFVAPESPDAPEDSTTTENGVITISVVAKPGFVGSGDPGPWTKPVAELEQLTGEDCEETPPPDDTEVDSAGPVPPTTPPAQAVRTAATPTQASAPVDPAPASLPATGSSSWALAGAALAAIAAGLLLTRLSRRPDEQVV